MSARIVVIGGGLAGASAGLELARRGASPVLVGGAPGATALTYGTLDVAAAAPGSRRLRWRSPLRDEPLCGRDRLAVLIDAYPDHPYTVLWRDRAVGAADATPPADEIKQAVAELDEALAPSGLRIHGGLDENRLLADGHGALRVSDFAFTGPASGDLSAASEIAWVTIEGLPGPPARVAIRRLAAELATLGQPPARMRTPILPLPPSLPTGSLPALLAALDRDDAFAAFLEAAGRLSDRGSPDRVWLFPPVLGLGRVGERLAALSERLGGPVAERLTVVPEATAGFRLTRALDTALDAAGVERHRARASGVSIREGRAAEVVLEGEGAPTLAADGVILATGRFLSGGLCDGLHGVREPLLGLPVHDASGRRIDGQPARAALKRRYLDAQPLFSAGVCTDSSLRVLAGPHSEARHPIVLPNLYVAGDLLAGFDPARERTGLGVALVTGRAAARSALAELGHAATEDVEG